jgi:hypothetical protein
MTFAALAVVDRVFPDPNTPVYHGLALRAQGELVEAGAQFCDAHDLATRAGRRHAGPAPLQRGLRRRAGGLRSGQG